MKQIVLAAVAALGVTAVAAPAQAVTLKWTVDYTGFFAEDASINGFFVAEDTAAEDGFVSGDEFDRWEWNWSGNSEVDAFTLTSLTAEAESFFGEFGFFVDGTPNEPEAGADQGLYVSDDFGLDLEFLLVQDFTSGSPFTGTTTFGDATAAGTVAVSDPEVVPEPATLLGLLTLAGAAAMAKRQKHAA